MDEALLLSVLLSQWCFSVSQYHLVVEPMSWSDAQTHCRQHYTDLATVTDMKDVEELKAAANGHTDAWIGLHWTSESDLNRTWHWSQPTVQYKEEETTWHTTEPNDAGGYENCVTVNNEDLWHDVPCEAEYRCCVCYNETSSTTFMIEHGNKTWLEAQKYCRTHHADLISGLYQQRLMDQKYPDRNFWCLIGLSRDNWGWADGSNSPFRNWKTTVNPVETKCAALRDGGRWDSDDCALKKSFICHGDKKTKKTLVKIKMSSPVDLNSLSPEILQQLQEHLKANNLRDVKLTWKKDDNHCVFKKEKSSSRNKKQQCDAA